MERTKSNECIFILFLLLMMAIPSVSAVTISFVDSAYQKANDYSITDQSGVLIANWTGSQTVTLPAGKSYSVDFIPNGIMDLSKQSAPNDFSGFTTQINFIGSHITQLIVLGAIFCLIVIWRNG